MTSPAFVQSKSANATFVTSTTGLMVWGVAPTDGNLLLFIIEHDAAEDVTLTGWTSFGARIVNNGTRTTMAFWKIAASEGTDVAATWTTSTRFVAAMVEISGQATAGFIDASNGQADATSPFTSAAITSVAGGDELLVGMLTDTGSTVPNSPVSTGTGTGASTLREAIAQAGASALGTALYTCPVTGASGNYTTQLSGGANGVIWAILVAAPSVGLPAGGRHMQAGEQAMMQTIGW